MKNKKFSIKNIFNIVFYLILACILIFSISNIVAAKNGKQPTLFGYSTYYIMTGSMEPTIPTGSLVIDKAGNTQDIRKGDIITFKDGINITTHRVYKVLDGGNEFITKGDANNVQDPMPRTRNQVLGVVQYHIPHLGNIAEFIKNNLIIIICGIIALFAAFNLLFMNKKEIK